MVVPSIPKQPTTAITSLLGGYDDSSSDESDDADVKPSAYNNPKDYQLPGTELMFAPIVIEMPAVRVETMDEELKRFMAELN